LPNPNGRISTETFVRGGPKGDLWVAVQGEVLRWNGTAWSVPDRIIFGYLESIVVTATDAWVLGGRSQVLRHTIP
jgi:hypothetical protein